MSATVLLLLGVQPRATQEIMGWPDPKVAERYQQVVAALRDDVAERVGDLLWPSE
jgi:integrase